MIFDIFSTRELAISIWICVVLIVCMLNKKIRTSSLGVLKALFVWQISASLLAFFIHTGFYTFLLYKIGFWNISQIKDTIIWTIGFGFVSLMSVNKVNDTKYFKNIFIDALKWTIVIEFVVNFFTFSLTQEIIFVFIIVCSAMIQTASSFDLKHKQLENWMKNFLMYVSIFIFLFSLYKTVEEHNKLFTLENLQSFLLPIYLTITFLPFMYFYNLLVKYEVLWARLKFMIKDEIERKRVKRQILFIANFDINKLVNISKNIAKPINVYNDTSNEMIKLISKDIQYIGNDL